MSNLKQIIVALSGVPISVKDITIMGEWVNTLSKKEAAYRICNHFNVTNIFMKKNIENAI